MENTKNEKQCAIHDVSSSASNGFRPNVYISDDLEDLKRRYTPEQLKKMWEDVYPKSSEIIGKVIITGTPK
jgi:proline dehydrogenase